MTKFTLPVFEQSIKGAGRPKLIGMHEVSLDLSADDVALAVKFAVHQAWKTAKGWTFPENDIARLTNSFRSIWKSEREESPLKALTRKLMLVYDVETANQLPSGPLSLLAAIRGGAAISDPMIRKATTALVGKFPDTDWPTLINLACDERQELEIDF